MITHFYSRNCSLLSKFEDVYDKIVARYAMNDA